MIGMDLRFVRERAMNLIKTCINFSKEMNTKQYVHKTSQKEIAILILFIWKKQVCARVTESILAGPVCGFTVQRSTSILPKNSTHPLCLL